jgi:hypothetical protein
MLNFPLKLGSTLDWDNRPAEQLGEEKRIFMRDFGHVCS